MFTDDMSSMIYSQRSVGREDEEHVYMCGM